ncbi:Uma2 family endonuclease [Roseomonas sp. CCTCC AB2023176]|uniref:Uma2 family endonuclease n=1 Tax=Roseomonas sp. CCTCC AB2023176 TaxID=3342640 RepID=UPI0035E22959
MDKPQPAPPGRMKVDEFLAWAQEQPEGQRYELEDGYVVTSSAGRVAHARVKGLVFLALRAAIAWAGLPCEALPDGPAVPVDEWTTWEPDALVRCGEPLPRDTVRVTDPVMVVEVQSPSTGTREVTTKLVDYFRIPSVRHYLIVHPGERAVVHHARAEGETGIATQIVGSGPLRLDPPGLELDVVALFAGV